MNFSGSEATLIDGGQASTGEVETLDRSDARRAIFGAFVLSISARLLTENGRPVAVGSRAFDLLALLVERAGEVVPRRDLMARGWPGLTVDEISLRVQIAGLRKALGEGANGKRYISNIPGRGYCFVAPVAFEAGVVPDAVHPLLPLPRPEEVACRSEPAMIGRDDIVGRIQFLLHTYRLVTIHGPGGMGKTTVAKGVAAAIAGAFDGPVVFVDVGSMTDPPFLSSALASALGLVVHDRDVLPAIMSMLRNRRTLIVLDGCEHAISTAAALAEALHQDASGATVLVTSREPLRAEGERVVSLTALSLPPKGAKLARNQLLAFSAVQLFAERAVAAGLPQDMTDADVRTIAGICIHLDGIPLALEIAASRAGRHGLVETASLLDGRFALLWQGRRAAVPRQQTLQATLDWSHDLLTPNEKALFASLSVFSAHFRREDAAAISLMDPHETNVALDELVAKSMVSIEVREQGVRYRLLDTTRAYAHARLHGTDEEARVQANLAASVSSRIARLDMLGLAPSGVDEAVEQAGSVADLLADLRSALSWLFEQPQSGTDPLELIASAAPMLFQLRLFAEARRWLELALSRLETAGRGGAEETLIEGAYGTALMLTQANSLRAQLAFERAIGSAETMEDWRTAFQLNIRLQLLHRRTAEFDRLHPLTDKAATYAERLGDEHAMASVRLLRGSAHALCGDQVAAENLLKRCLYTQLTQPTSPQHFAFTGNAWVPLSLTLWLRGLNDQAGDAARTLVQDTGDVLFSCLAWSWATMVLQLLGSTDEAAAMSARLRQAADRHLLHPYRAVALGFEGQTLLASGQPDASVKLFQQAVASLCEARYGLYGSIFSRGLVTALLDIGNVQTAQHITSEHLDKIERSRGAYDQPEWLRLKGLVEAAAGRPAEAEQTFRTALALSQKQGAIAWRLRSAVSLARLAFDSGRPSDVKVTLASALAAYPGGATVPDTLAARELLAVLG